MYEYIYKIIDYKVKPYHFCIITYKTKGNTIKVNVMLCYVPLSIDWLVDWLGFNAVYNILLILRRPYVDQLTYSCVF